MKAMILAAGKGERFNELTRNIPKALLNVAGMPMIVRRIEQLQQAGVTDIVINLHQHGEQIQKALGHGEKWQCNIDYVYEPELLETGGGMINALPLLGKNPFVVCSCDTITDFDFKRLTQHTLSHDILAHLILVANPDHHQQGDYGIHENLLSPGFTPRYNYAGFALIDPKLLTQYQPGYRKIAEIFNDAMTQKKVSGELFNGHWINVDNKTRLLKAERFLSG